MRIVIDKINNIEYTEKLCDECVECGEKEYINFSPYEYPELLHRCESCDLCKLHGNCAQPAHKSKIGESLLDFMSLDFIKIKNELLNLIDKEKKIDNDNVIEQYLLQFHWIFELYVEQFFQLLQLSKIDSEFNFSKDLNREFDRLISIQKIIKEYSINEIFANDSYIIDAIYDWGIFSPPESIEDEIILQQENEYDIIKRISSNNIIKVITLRADELRHRQSAVNKNQVYLIHDIGDYCGLLFEIIQKFNYSIKKCANCGKFFIPYNRSDTIYCDRVSPQDETKTCKEYGAMKAYQLNLKNNEAMGLYRKIYMSKQMLAKRNPDIIDYSESFEKFKVNSKQWKVDVKTNTKTEEAYVEWLKMVKETKVF